MRYFVYCGSREKKKEVPYTILNETNSLPYRCQMLMKNLLDGLFFYMFLEQWASITTRWYVDDKMEVR